MPPSAASMARRRRLLMRTGLQIGRRGDGIAGRRIEHAVRTVAHVDFLGRGIEQQARVLQRLDHRGRIGVTATSHRGNAGFGVAERVGGEFRQSLVECLGAAGRRRNQQSKRKRARDQTIAQHSHLNGPGIEWSGGGRQAASVFSSTIGDQLPWPPHFLVTRL